MPAISYQLYSSRNWPLADTFTMLSETGFTEVEGYDGLFGNTDELLALLDISELRMTTAHFGLLSLETAPDNAIALAKKLGLEAVFAPYLAEEDRPHDVPGWEAFATRLANAGKPVLDAGLVYGWHNHDFELIDLGNGVTPLDLIANASPDIHLELDLGWVTRAGRNPLASIRQYGSQIAVAHIKDVAANGENRDEDGWADVGYGSSDWASIHTALQEAGVNRYVIEHDNPNDHQRFAARSLKTVQAF